MFLKYKGAFICYYFFITLASTKEAFYKIVLQLKTFFTGFYMVLCLSTFSKLETSCIQLLYGAL